MHYTVNNIKMPQLDWVCFFYDNFFIVFILTLYITFLPISVAFIVSKFWTRIFVYILRLSQLKLK